MTAPRAQDTGTSSSPATPYGRSVARCYKVGTEVGTEGRADCLPTLSDRAATGNERERTARGKLHWERLPIEWGQSGDRKRKPRNLRIAIVSGFGFYNGADGES